MLFLVSIHNAVNLFIFLSILGLCASPIGNDMTKKGELLITPVSVVMSRLSQISSLRPNAFLYFNIIHKPAFH